MTLSIRIAIFLILTAFVGLHTAAKEETNVSDTQKAVLVTGASTGIGRKIAESLAAKGHYVYAGARKKSDLIALDKIDNVEGIRLDVTIPSEIQAAALHITQSGRGLHGLVNNAGVAVLDALIEMEESDLEFTMDVNVFGPYRVTKAFSPLLIKSQGRVTTIGSISGILSGKLFGSYSMSKHAVEAYTDTLAAEMADLNVKVSVVEPGNYQSDIRAKIKHRLEASQQGEKKSLYEADMERLKDWADRQYKEPDEVADAVHHALFAEHPKRRYLVVPNEREAEITIRQIIKEMVELNQDQAYSFDRERLIGMLDEALGVSPK